jgi:hypothetical protein
MHEDRWVSYFDLADLGFVNPATGKPFSRKHLIDMQRRGEWPKATQISRNRIAWRLSELIEREATLPHARSVREPASDAGAAPRFVRRAPLPVEAAE